jgi:hypothetical protein
MRLMCLICVVRHGLSLAGVFLNFIHVPVICSMGKGILASHGSMHLVRRSLFSIFWRYIPDCTPHTLRVIFSLYFNFIPMHS